MPNLWTHFIFGQEVLDQVQPGTWTDDPARLHLYNLGCQGPDLLFYHNAWPWSRDKSVSALGNLMHRKQCGPALMTMIERSAGLGPDHPSLVYTLGFVMHHVLDRAMHPFVFYYSGFKKWDHQRFEVIMDAIVVERFRGIQTWREPAWPHLNVGSRLPEEVAELLAYVVHRFYPEDARRMTKHTFQEAYRDFIRLQRLFHDPSGWKRRITFGQIEPMVPKSDYAPLDYMNEAGRAWLHPAVPSERYTYSAWDLWDEAFEDAVSVTEACFAYWDLMPGRERDDAFERLRRLIGNVTYDTGKPCDWDLDITISDPIWR